MGFSTKENPLPDGRYLCSICVGLALKPGESIEPIKATVIKAMSTVGFGDLQMEKIPIEVVSAEQMAKIFNTSINPHNKGLIKVATGFLQKYSYTIYMLTYLNKIEMAGALAHEILHAWLIENGVQMSQKYTEGFCNMGAYLMWNRLGSSLTKTYLKILHENPCPIYGDGFREIHAMYEELGWEGLIKMVREKKLK